MSATSSAAAAADREVASKSEAKIERETAEKWCERALACYRQFARTKDVAWLLRATGYRQEAMEHAAMVEDRGKTVGAMQDRLAAACKAAFGSRCATGKARGARHRMARR